MGVSDAIAVDALETPVTGAGSSESGRRQVTGLAPGGSGTSKKPGWPALLLLAGAVHAGALLADEQGEGPVTWGHEENGGSRTLEVPFSTPRRDRVEIVAAFRYTDRRLRELGAMMRAWQESLPASVELLRVPLVRGREDGDSRLSAHRRGAPSVLNL